MALTNSQKAKIRRYLGYPDVGTETDWRLEGAMTELSEEGELEVEAILTTLASLDQQRTSNLAYAHLKRAEEVEFYPGGFAALAQERARLIAELARILGVEPIPLSGAGMSNGACLRG